MRPCAVCSGENGCSHRRSTRQRHCTVCVGCMHNQNATRHCTVCSGENGCSHRRSTRQRRAAPGFSRGVGGHKATRCGNMRYAPGRWAQSQRNASVYGVQWSGVAQRRRDAVICGLRRGGMHNHNAMRRCTVYSGVALHNDGTTRQYAVCAGAVGTITTQCVMTPRRARTTIARFLCMDDRYIIHGIDYQ